MTTLSSAPLIRWHALPDATAIQLAVVDLIRFAAEDAIDKRGRFDLVLAGGSTPKAIYQACRHLDTDWARWHCYFGDERCLPPDNPERNSVMAHVAWLHHVPIPAAQIHVIPAELGAEAASTDYANVLIGVGDFDFVLLGLGEDGHTASLFPGHLWGENPDAADALAVFDAPKPPPERVSLSAHRLSRARQVAFVVTGEGKHQAITDWRAGKTLPAGAISPTVGVDVFCEETLLAPLR